MKKSKDFIIMMGLILTGLSITMLNQSIINIALSHIMNDFNVKVSLVQWLSTGYMLISGILVPVSAYLIKKFTYKQLFIAAMSFFVVGSFISAISWNFYILLLGRLFQAVSGGILLPLSMNIFMFSFPAKERGSAMGILGLGVILAPAIGPTVGGYILESYNWNMLFYLMATIGVVLLTLTVLFFRIESEKSDIGFDKFGVILTSIGFGMLLYAVNEGSDKGWISRNIIMLTIAILLLAIFVFRSFKIKDPLLELKVFKDYTFSLTLIINIIFTIVLYSGLILLPIYLQNIRNFSSRETGLLLLPGSLAMGFVGLLAGKLYDKLGMKPLAIFGTTVMIIVTFLFSRIDMETTYLHILILYTLRSIGMAFVIMPIAPAGLAKIDKTLIAHATALQNALRQVAGAAGTAIIVSVTTSAKNSYLSSISKEQTESIIRNAEIHGISVSFILTSIIASVALVLSLFLKSKKSEAINLGKEAENVS